MESRKEDAPNPSAKSPTKLEKSSVRGLHHHPKKQHPVQQEGEGKEQEPQQDFQDHCSFQSTLLNYNDHDEKPISKGSNNIDNHKKNTSESTTHLRGTPKQEKDGRKTLVSHQDEHRIIAEEGEGEEGAPIRVSQIQSISFEKGALGETYNHHHPGGNSPVNEVEEMNHFKFGDSLTNVGSNSEVFEGATIHREETATFSHMNTSIGPKRHSENNVVITIHSPSISQSHQPFQGGNFPSPQLMGTGSSPLGSILTAAGQETAVARRPRRNSATPTMDGALPSTGPTQLNNFFTDAGIVTTNLSTENLVNYFLSFFTLFSNVTHHHFQPFLEMMEAGQNKPAGAQLSRTPTDIVKGAFYDCLSLLPQASKHVIVYLFGLGSPSTSARPNPTVVPSFPGSPDVPFVAETSVRSTKLAGVARPSTLNAFSSVHSDIINPVPPSSISPPTTPPPDPAIQQLIAKQWAHVLFDSLNSLLRLIEEEYIHFDQAPTGEMKARRELHFEGLMARWREAKSLYFSLEDCRMLQQASSTTAVSLKKETSVNTNLNSSSGATMTTGKKSVSPPPEEQRLLSELTKVSTEFMKNLSEWCSYVLARETAKPPLFGHQYHHEIVFASVLKYDFNLTSEAMEKAQHVDDQPPIKSGGSNRHRRRHHSFSSRLRSWFVLFDQQNDSVVTSLPLWQFIFWNAIVLVLLAFCAGQGLSGKGLAVLGGISFLALPFVAVLAYGYYQCRVEAEKRATLSRLLDTYLQQTTIKLSAVVQSVLFAQQHTSAITHQEMVNYLSSTNANNTQQQQVAQFLESYQTRRESTTLTLPELKFADDLNLEGSNLTQTNSKKWGASGSGGIPLAPPPPPSSASLIRTHSSNLNPSTASRVPTTESSTAAASMTIRSNLPNPLNNALISQQAVEVEDEEEGIIRVKLDPTGSFLLPFLDDTDPIVLDGEHIHRHVAMVGIEFMDVPLPCSDAGSTLTVPQSPDEKFSPLHSDFHDRYAICLWNHAMAEATGGFTSTTALTLTLSSIVADTASYHIVDHAIKRAEQQLNDPKQHGIKCEPFILRCVHRVRGMCRMQMTIAPVTTYCIEEERDILTGVLLLGATLDPRTALVSYAFRNLYLAEVMEQFFLEESAAREIATQRNIMFSNSDHNLAASRAASLDSVKSINSEKPQFPTGPRSSQDTATSSNFLSKKNERELYRFVPEMNDATAIDILRSVSSLETFDVRYWEPVYTSCIPQLFSNAFGYANYRCEVDSSLPAIIECDVPGITGVVGEVLKLKVNKTSTGSSSPDHRSSAILLSTPSQESVTLVITLCGLDFEALHAMLNPDFVQGSPLGGTSKRPFSPHSASLIRDELKRLNGFVLLSTTTRSGSGPGTNVRESVECASLSAFLFFPFKHYTGATLHEFKGGRTPPSQSPLFTPMSTSVMEEPRVTQSQLRPTPTRGTQQQLPVAQGRPPIPLANGQVPSSTGQGRMSTSENESSTINSSIQISAMVVEPNEIERTKLVRSLFDGAHAVCALEEPFFSAGVQILRSNMQKIDAVIIRQSAILQGNTGFSESESGAVVAFNNYEAMEKIFQEFSTTVFIIVGERFSRKAPGGQRSNSPNRSFRSTSQQLGTMAVMEKKESTMSAFNSESSPAMLSAPSLTAEFSSPKDIRSSPVIKGIHGRSASDMSAMGSDYNRKANWQKQFANVHFASALATQVAIDQVIDIAIREVEALRIEQKKKTDFALLLRQHRGSPWVRGKKLGKGTFGDVYVAEMTLTGGQMAVKVIHLRSEDEEHLASLVNEISILCQVSHPNIVQYFYCEAGGANNDEVHLFMELCRGGSLEKIIRDAKKGGGSKSNSATPTTSSIAGGPKTGKDSKQSTPDTTTIVTVAAPRKGALSDTDASLYTQQMLSALQYLHAKGIAHRDIKPANILLNEGRAKLADFGTAKITSGQAVLNEVAGTFQYMAPEVVGGESYGRSCDIWSVGCVVLEMFNALPQPVNAFANSFDTCTTDAEILAAIPGPLPTPEALSFVSRCLKLNPVERSTADELLIHPFVFEVRRSVGLQRKFSGIPVNVSFPPPAPMRQSIGGQSLIGALSVCSEDFELESKANNKMPFSPKDKLGTARGGGEDSEQSTSTTVDLQFNENANVWHSKVPTPSASVQTSKEAVDLTSIPRSGVSPTPPPSGLKRRKLSLISPMAALKKRVGSGSLGSWSRANTELVIGSPGQHQAFGQREEAPSSANNTTSHNNDDANPVGGMGSEEKSVFQTAVPTTHFTSFRRTTAGATRNSDDTPMEVLTHPEDSVVSDW